MSSSSTSEPNHPNPNKPPIVTGYPATTPIPTPATAYPYPAPHPPPQQQPYYYPNGAVPQPHFYAPQTYPHFSPSNSARILLRRLVYICILFFLVFGAITLILWLVLRPRLPEVTLASATLSNFNLSSNSLNADFRFNLTIKNPSSKMGIVYDRVTAAVLYGDETVAETALPPFYQARGNVTGVSARLVAAGEYVEEEVVKGIGGSGGEIRFDFRFLSFVRFRSGAWGTRRHVLRVYCDGVPFGMRNSTGVMVGEARKCLVHL